MYVTAETISHFNRKKKKHKKQNKTVCSCKKKKKNRHKLLLYLKITSHILNADRLNDMILNDNLFWQDLFIVI